MFNLMSLTERGEREIPGLTDEKVLFLTVRVSRIHSPFLTFAPANNTV